MRLLIVEDDKEISSYLSKGLKQSGFASDTVENAEKALSALQTSPYDIAIIDLMLPAISGEKLIEQIREQDLNLPILILSAKRSVEERVEGLSLGADDYITKPFSFSELLARINALLRRSKNTDVQTNYTIADLTLDLRKRQVYRSGKQIDLRPREFSLLEYLLRHKGQVMPKTIILEHLWDFHFDPQTNVVDVLVHRLRKKVDDSFEPKLIHTIRGVGYVIRDESSEK